MMRIVFDTNIVISSLFWDGLPRAILDKVRERELILLTSEDYRNGTYQGLRV